MPSSLYAAAIRLLARREHSKFELKNKLLKNGFVASEIDTLLWELDRKKLQSDERFAESCINMRRGHGFGPLKIIAELKNKGIDKITIEKLLSAYATSWSDFAIEQYNKKFGNCRPKNRLELAKQVRYLMGKGFTREQLKICIDYEQSD